MNWLNHSRHSSEDDTCTGAGTGSAGVRITFLVTVGYLRVHRMLALLLFAVSLISALLPVVMFNGLDAYVQAMKESAAGQFGGYAYQISGGSDAVASSMTELVHTGDVVSVTSTRGSLGIISGGESLRTISDLTFLTGPSRYGTIITGRQPNQAHEIALSREATDQISAELGDTVSVECDETLLSGEYTLVGITVNPTNTGEVTAAAVTSPDTATDTQLWLTDNSTIAGSGVVADELNTGSVAVGYLESNVDRAVDSACARNLPGYQWYRLVLFLCLVCVHTAMIIACYRAGRCNGTTVVDALQAGGFPPRTARWILLRGLLACMLPGAAIGVVAGYAIFSVCHGILGEWFGQYWHWILSPASLIAVAFVITILACAYGLAWLILFRRHQHRNASLAAGRSTLWYVVPSIIVLLAACVAIERYHAAAWAQGGIAGMLLGSCALGVLLVSLPWLACTPAQCQSVDRSRALAAPACALALLLLAAGSWMSGQMMLATGSPDNGLFVADYLSEQDITYLRDRYPEIIDDAVILTAPDESQYLVRAASQQYYDCVVERGVDDFECDAGTGISESTVMLIDSDSPIANTASSDQMGEDETVGVILIDPATQAIMDSARMDVNDTNPLLDDQVMPGLILGIDSPQARALGITPGNQHTLVITGFPSIASGTRDAIRSDIINRCGYSFITEYDTTSFRSYQSRAIAMPILTAFCACLIFAALAVSTRHSQARLRRTLQEFGADRFQLMRLFMPLGITMSAGSALALLLGWLGSHPWIIAPSPEFGSAGYWWLLPLPLMLAETVALAWWNSQPEPTEIGLDGD